MPENPHNLPMTYVKFGKENIDKYGVLGIEIELLEKGKSQIERINKTIEIIEEVTNSKI